MYDRCVFRDLRPFQPPNLSPSVCTIIGTQPHRESVSRYRVIAGHAENGRPTIECGRHGRLFEALIGDADDRVVGVLPGDANRSLRTAIIVEVDG